MVEVGAKFRVQITFDIEFDGDMWRNHELQVFGGCIEQAIETYCQNMVDFVFKRDGESQVINEMRRKHRKTIGGYLLPVAGE